MGNYYTEKEVSEKAREIHGKMWIEGGNTNPKEAIRCALVLVDEQINECLDGFSYTDYRRNFWDAVKNELESYINDDTESKNLYKVKFEDGTIHDVKAEQIMVLDLDAYIKSIKKNK